MDAGAPSEKELLQSFCAIQPTTFPDNDTSDVSFTTSTAASCFAGPCLCGLPNSQTQNAVDSIARCEGISTGFDWGQGSVVVRITGRSSGKCLVEVVTETEGGANDYACEIPLPVAPWAGLLSNGDDVSFMSGIEQYCQLTTQCSLISGSDTPCGPDIPRCSPSSTGACE